MPTIIDQAIIVRLWDFSETSQTVSLFLREHGMLRGLAKGSRREKGKFCGGLDLLTRGEIVAIVKPSAELAILTEWDLLEVYWGPRRSLKANRVGLYMVDLVHHALTPHDPHPALFDSLARGLAGLEAGATAMRVAVQFQWDLLVETGYQPRLEALDWEADGEKPARAYGFDPSTGSLGPDPGPEQSGGAKSRVWRVRADTVEFLRRLGRGEASEAMVAEVAERAGRLLGAYLESIAGQPIPSGASLFESR